MLSPRPCVHAIPEYHPPLAGRTGLRLDFNENTDGCSPAVLKRLQRMGAEELASYPERGLVEGNVAQFLGVDPSELLLTNGVDEAIHLLCQTFLEPRDEAIIVVPTYSMYRIYMMAAGANVVSITAANDFAFPRAELISRLSPRTRMIAIANPNNPTGSVVSQDQLLGVARAAPNAAVLVDEAYFEFYGQSILPSRGSAPPNLFVTRTFSKVYGLAGLRIGALIGDPAQMQNVRRVCSPYNVNAVALASLPEAIADQEYIRRYVAEVLESRSRLERALDTAGLPWWPSQGNFILARIGSASFVDGMKRRGILVRDRSQDPGCEGCVRITVGSRAVTDRLLIALQQCLEEVGALRGVAKL